MSKRAAPHAGPWVIPGTHSVNPVVFLLCAANMSSVSVLRVFNVEF